MLRAVGLPSWNSTSALPHRPSPTAQEIRYISPMEKSDISTSSPSSSPALSPTASPVLASSSKAIPSDVRSVMSQDPPPYSEAGPSLLLSPPPEVIRATPNPPPLPSRRPSQQPNDQVRADAGKSTQRFVSNPGPSDVSQPGPSRSPYSPSQMQLVPAGAYVRHHRPKSLPELPPVDTLQPSSPKLRAPSPRATYPLSPQPSNPTSPSLGRRCNFYSERNQSSSLKGTYHLDTDLSIPEPLRPPMTEFHGFWNEMDKKAVKAREKERKAREKEFRKAQGGGWGRRKSVPFVDPAPPPRLANEGVKPNLMLASKDGGVQAEVNVTGSSREVATIVAESNDGSVKLTVNDPSGQALRIFAISMDGSVRVRIPPTFQGAIWMTTEDGSVHLSEGVKSRLMIFSQTTKTARCYIGDWQSTQFGRAPSSSQETDDPFKSWTGSLAHIYSRDGSVHLAFAGEDTSSTFSRAMKSIYNGIVGGSHEKTDEEDGARRSPKERLFQQVQNDPRMVWPSRQIEGVPRMGLSSLFPEVHQADSRGVGRRIS